MYARTTIAQFQPGTTDEAISILRDIMLPKFEIEDSVERPPYEDVEVQTHRTYIFARKPH